MMDRFKYYGVAFDDVTEDEDTCMLWSQICEPCTKKFPSEINFDLERDFGEGLCGVEGCENEADHYISFLLTREISIVTEREEI